LFAIVAALDPSWPAGGDWRELLTAAATPAIFAAIWLFAATHIGVYRVPPKHDVRLALRRTLDAWLVTWGLGGLTALTLIPPNHLAVWPLLGAGLAATLLLRLLAAVAWWWDADTRLRALVVGTSSAARSLSDGRPGSAFDVVGIVPFTNETAGLAERHLGALQDLPRLLRDEHVDVAVVSPSDAAITGEVRAAFRACADHGVAVRYFPHLLDVDDSEVCISWKAGIGHLDVMQVTHPDRALSLAAKRAIDLVGSGLGVLALLPVFVGCALAIKLTSSGPIFYRQTRVGAGGRQFSCLKFRTMRVGADRQQELLRSASLQDGPAFKMAGDPRITRVGGFLRKFSLDELPQLLNVLVGDMSLVGPRPPIPSEVERYAWWQRRRVSVKPGLTCLWQVWGRNRVSFKRWVEMDLYYIDNWTLWMDVKLILHTLRVVAKGTGM
jgi:exopolysaccharide biosynthesis polyprenyl glycosylphosphotransferase